MFKLNRSIVLAIVGFISLTFTCSAFARDCTFPFTKDPAPSWICNDDPTSFPDYVYVASGSRVRSKMKGSLTRNLAIMDARNNLARAISTDVAARLRMHIEELTDGELTWGNSIADETAFNFTHEILKDTIVIDTIGGSDDMYYVLIGMRSTAAKKAIKAAVLSTLNDDRADHIRSIGKTNFDELTELVANDGFVPKKKPEAKKIVQKKEEKKTPTTSNYNKADSDDSEPAPKVSAYSRVKANAAEVGDDVKNLYKKGKERMFPEES